MSESLTSIRKQVAEGALPESALLARLIKEEHYRTRYLKKIRKEIADLHESEKGELHARAARLPHASKQRSRAIARYHDLLIKLS